MKIIVVGAGPSGMICAGICAQNKNNKVLLFEAGEKPGKKLFITGKGRCNICNDCNLTDFLSNVVTNNRFMFSAINNFTPQNTMTFFKDLGVKLKTERGLRVFPSSDKSSEIIKSLLNFLKKNNVEISLNTKVFETKKVGEKFFLKTSKGNFECDALIIATGGKSYSSTGSTGDGYKFAKHFNHLIVPVKPALVPIILLDYNGSLEGLSLKNVRCKISLKNKKFSEFGEMLFTHNGVSGPIILTLSSFINKYDLKDASLSIDLKPALSHKQLDDRFVRDLQKSKNKELKNYLKEFLPSSLIFYFIKSGNFDGKMKVGNVSKKTRQEIVFLLKELNFKIARLDDIEYAIITSGGVDVKNINPKNMESKLTSNLFFVGEVLDVDALTGGFNLQIAFSTGFAAGEYLKNLHLKKKV